MGFMHFWGLLSKKDGKMSIETLKKYRFLLIKRPKMSVKRFKEIVKRLEYLEKKAVLNLAFDRI
ncbi:hypothetical protein CDQ71_00115 [Campylobacter hyointestinalis subsp. hyointestinalis]|nr:hypothetical protein CDQ71_00115 [Campylobacter hyointestinalis subsp. hyointestinalis]